MGIVFSKPAPVQPATVPTDTIIPFRCWDGLPHLIDRVLNITFRFDDVLDTEKLRAALARLLEKGDWRKLGARIRRNDAGKFEHHVPAEYDDQRPGFKFTSVTYGMNIDEHPLLSRLPKMTDRPSVFNDPLEFLPVVRSADAPTKMDDWLYSDRPQLTIHVAAFNDATLVTVTFSHTLTDIMGLCSILKAWTAILHGHEDQVPPFTGFDYDPMESVNEATPADKHVLWEKQLKGMSTTIYWLRLTFEKYWYPKEEHVVFVPGKFVKQMRQSALEQLAAETKSEEKKPFVSEADIHYAWWSRVMLSAVQPAADRTISMVGIFNVRGLLEDLLPAHGAYVGNAAKAAVALLSAHEVLGKPLGFVASRLRAALMEQRTREQVEAFSAMNKAAIEKSGVFAFGDSGMLVLMCSDWSKGKLFEVDFSPAVVKVGLPLAQRANRLGRPSYISPATPKGFHALRNSGGVVGQDPAGNWWTQWTMRAEAWPKVEEALKKASYEGK